MNRRTFTLGTIPAALVALAELRGVAASNGPTKSGTCGACKNNGSCNQGLVCLGGVCGPEAAACGGKFYTCHHRRFVCRQGDVPTCFKKHANRRYVAASPLCPAA
jgi:hypothetical protein